PAGRPDRGAAAGPGDRAGQSRRADGRGRALRRAVPPAGRAVHRPGRPRRRNGGDAAMKGMVPGVLRVLAISWGVNKRKTLTAITLAMSGTAAGPLLAFSLGKLTDAVVHGRPLVAATYGGLAAVFAIMTLSCSNFASVAEHELAELAEQAFVERLMGVSNGSAGIEHHERPDYADMVTVLDPESRRFPNALQSLFSMFGLALAVTFTAVLLAGLNPVLLLLTIAALPPLYTGRWAERITDRSRTDTAEPTRIARNLFRLSSSARFAGEVR